MLNPKLSEAVQLVLKQMMLDVSEIRRKLTYLAGDN